MKYVFVPKAENIENNFVLSFVCLICGNRKADKDFIKIYADKTTYPGCIHLQCLIDFYFKNCNG